LAFGELHRQADVFFFFTLGGSQLMAFAIGGTGKELCLGNRAGQVIVFLLWTLGEKQQAGGGVANFLRTEPQEMRRRDARRQAGDNQSESQQRTTLEHVKTFFVLEHPTTNVARG
jgi:hypothetical protein